MNNVCAKRAKDRMAQTIVDTIGKIQTCVSSATSFDNSLNDVETAPDRDKRHTNSSSSILLVKSVKGRYEYGGLSMD